MHTFTTVIIIAYWGTGGGQQWWWPCRGWRWSTCHSSTSYEGGRGEGRFIQQPWSQERLYNSSLTLITQHVVTSIYCVTIISYTLLAHADIMFYCACCRDSIARHWKAGSSTCKVQVKRQSHKIAVIIMHLQDVCQTLLHWESVCNVLIISHQPRPLSGASKICAPPKGCEGQHIYQAEPGNSNGAYPWLSVNSWSH